MPTDDFQKLLTSLRHKGLIGKQGVLKKYTAKCYNVNTKLVIYKPCIRMERYMYYEFLGQQLAWVLEYLYRSTFSMKGSTLIYSLSIIRIQD